MSENLTTFEVIVEVERGNHYGYHPVYKGSNAKKGAFIKDTILKMFHFDRRTPRQAINAGMKHGKVLHCRKADAQAMLGNPEKIVLDQTIAFGVNNPYKNAIAMDEMIWQKRNKRRTNSFKDKRKI